jgi:hypothetical protein
VVVVVISPPSIFTLRSLRLLASPVKSDGCATSGFLCVHYDVLLGRSPSWFIERSCAVGGRYPLRTHTTPLSPKKTTNHSRVNSRYAPCHPATSPAIY